jgi:hypothetical protein
MRRIPLLLGVLFGIGLVSGVVIYLHHTTKIFAPDKTDAPAHPEPWLSRERSAPPVMDAPPFEAGTDIDLGEPANKRKLREEQTEERLQVLEKRLGAVERQLFEGPSEEPKWTPLPRSPSFRAETSSPRVPPPDESRKQSLGSVPHTPAAPERQQTLSVFSPQFVDWARQSLEEAHIAFNAPRSMRLGETIQIALLLSLRESIDQLIENLKNRPTTVGEKQGADIRVSNRMAARLTGEGFTITAIMPELQVVGSSGTTEWKWEIKAITPGRHTLHMTLTVIVYVEAAQTPLAIHAFDRQIEVVVSWYYPVGTFVGNNWQWLWTALLVPIGGWLWARYFRRKNSDNLIS